MAATLLSRYAVPVLYLLLARHGRAAELQRRAAPIGEGLALLAPGTEPSGTAA